MMQRQRQQHAIVALDELHVGGRVQLRDNIAVTQRHTFRRTGCSRCVKQDRFIFVAHRRKFYLLVVKEPLPIRLRRIVLAGIEQDELWFFFEIEFLDALHSFFGRDNRARIAVLQRVNKSLVAKLDIQWHNHHPRANNSQSRSDPFRAVLRKQRNGFAAFKIAPSEPVRERARARCQFLKRPTVSILLAKNHQRRLVAGLA